MRRSSEITGSSMTAPEAMQDWTCALRWTKVSVSNALYMSAVEAIGMRSAKYLTVASRTEALKPSRANLRLFF